MASANLKVQSTQNYDEWFHMIQPAYDDIGNPNFLDSNGDLVEGIYSGVPNSIYHELDAYSSSLIKELAKNTPAHVYRQYFSDEERKRTTAQRNTLDTGSFGHELILEPIGFYDRYFRVPLAIEYPNALHTNAELKDALKALGKKVSGTKPDLVKRLLDTDPNALIFDDLIAKSIIKGAGVKAYNEAVKLVDSSKCSTVLAAFNDGALSHITKKTPIDGLVWDDAHRILETFKSHARAKRLISNGFAELTVIARDPDSGLMLKVKFDYINKHAIASDVKSTRSANPNKFRFQCRDLRYDVQESFYKYVANLAGIPVKLFAFIGIEYLEADICEVFEMKRTRQVVAHRDMKKAIATLKECLDSENWYGYTKNDEVVVIDW
ncbi:PD-(D/E)XK nuclease-like domain-containing protein [Pseudoalteromonas sp. SG41-5]|uniref:PD-(D/E)XK nuclease-like domain-containing protein n=1 Tax=Pseudoalteromonas sp. SG41-5 TaxID=2760975 RepID=UPI0016037102|nr:PD-(D/E)XK nuclease-like domain-containing protein [Pseudoalteromonas sp. SG41-5]MBB1469001.1 PD-(D/E)XK nuclease-like domain-containing protein [Pseudoalteromonas sp. SG41-5]